MAKISFPHPGVIIKKELMKPMGLTAYRVAKGLGISQTAIGRILSGSHSISPAMALRLERYTRISAETWINLQSAYDLDKARKNPKLQLALKLIPRAK